MQGIGQKTPVLKKYSAPREPFRSFLDREPPASMRVRVDRLWGRMAFEVNLMTTRINWLVTSQAFLSGAFFLGIARIREGARATEILVPVIPMAGLLICFITFVYVEATVKIVGVCRGELDIIKRQYKRFFFDHMDADPDLIKQRVNAIVASKVLIAVFATFWAVALGLFIYDMNFMVDMFSPQPIAVEIVTRPEPYNPQGR